MVPLPAKAAPAPELPHPHDLWLKAGGGTDHYDPDRFVALLREAGWASPRATLTVILERVLGQYIDPEHASYHAPGVARDLSVELARHGYRIHDIIRCVRPPDAAGLGRPMSREEEAELVPR